MPVIPITPRGFAQNITIPKLEANPINNMGDAAQSVGSSAAVDAVVDGLTAIGLTKGWVTLIEIVTVLVILGFAGIVLGLIGGLITGDVQRDYRITLQERAERLRAIRQDLEKGVVENEVKDEAKGQQSDTDSVKTLVWE